MSVIRHKVTFLGSGSYGSVVKLAMWRGNIKWNLAVQVSFVNAGIWEKHGGYSRSYIIKNFEDIIPEITGARLMATLRQPSFVDYFGTYIIQGADFVRRSHSKTTGFVHDLYEALLSRENTNREVWRKFSGDNHVMLICQGLGDGGDLSYGIKTYASTLTPQVTRQWCFTLFWSLLAAQRTFGFQHRDIKISNMVLCNRGAADMKFRLSHVKDLDNKVFFKLERHNDDLSRFVPCFIDFNFSVYAMTTFAPGSDPHHVLYNWLRAQRLKQKKESPLGLYSFEVNPMTKALSSYPSPDLLFFPDGSHRDYASDVYSLGIAMLHLLAGDANLLLTLVPEFYRESFMAELELAAYELMGSAGTAYVKKHCDPQILLPTLLVMDALGHGVLPTDELQQQSSMYRILDKIRNRIENHNMRPYIMAKLDAIKERHGPEALDFLRSCLTWTKETRGVFPGCPPYKEDSPATYRLLFHPYFAPLRSTQEEHIKRKTGTNEYYGLSYAPPLTPAAALKSPTRAQRMYERILLIEKKVVEELETALNVKTFERRFFKVTKEILIQLEEEKIQEALANAETVMEGESNPKRARVDQEEEDDDTQTGSMMVVDEEDESPARPETDESIMDLDDDAFERIMDNLENHKEYPPWTKPRPPISLVAEEEDLDGL